MIKLSDAILDANDEFASMSNRYETPKGSCGQCGFAAVEYKRFLEGRGIACKQVQVEAFLGAPEHIHLNAVELKKMGGAAGGPSRMMGRGGRDPMAVKLAYAGKDFIHNINVLETKEGPVYVDWTARQFDPEADFPAIFSKDELMKSWEKLIE